ncbi:Coiled coil helix coiled coil helix [Trichuris trichiura]|uniref:Coiled coil helix coiled coil helix n=1 Tax=Trichuris trichiura TaxID=36087 RepID=A0A077ZEK5_TRITR|nr:Coiled coil helix coiled coil helix [Trichuris trichiura]
MPRRRVGRSSAPPRRPAARPAPPPPAPQQPQQGPGLLGQMAATAGGVAIGSAVGHALGNALIGDKGPMVDAEPVQQQVPDQPMAATLQKPCEFELQQFLECAKNNDLSLCEGFNQVLKECRTRYNV